MSKARMGVQVLQQSLFLFSSSKEIWINQNAGQTTKTTRRSYTWNSSRHHDNGYWTNCDSHNHNTTMRNHVTRRGWDTFRAAPTQMDVGGNLCKSKTEEDSTLWVFSLAGPCFVWIMFVHPTGGGGGGCLVRNSLSMSNSKSFLALLRNKGRSCELQWQCKPGLSTQVGHPP